MRSFDLFWICFVGHCSLACIRPSFSTPIKKVFSQGICDCILHHLGSCFCIRNYFFCHRRVSSVIMASYIGSNLWRFVYGIYFAVCNLLRHFLFLSKSFPFRLPYLFRIHNRRYHSFLGFHWWNRYVLRFSLYLWIKKEGPRPSFIF